MRSADSLVQIFTRVLTRLLSIVIKALRTRTISKDVFFYLKQTSEMFIRVITTVPSLRINLQGGGEICRNLYIFQGNLFSWLPVQILCALLPASLMTRFQGATIPKSNVWCKLNAFFQVKGKSVLLKLFNLRVPTWDEDYRGREFVHIAQWCKLQKTQKSMKNEVRKTTIQISAEVNWKPETLVWHN